MTLEQESKGVENLLCAYESSPIHGCKAVQKTQLILCIPVSIPWQMFQPTGLTTWSYLLIEFP